MYLTAKQKETYQFIKIFIDKNGRPPSYEEIREAHGVQ